MEFKTVTVLEDVALTEVSGGHKKRYYKRVEQTVTQSQSESVDLGGSLTLDGGSTLTITFGDQSQSSTQSA